ncbi:hypothetical protein [Neisseria sp. CCUG12390]|uniref:hypothetical protein n=1 Tax=Neisseria sp. CCUG12390 TaxID=3392035 RepID=UPI003A0FDB54
MISEECGSHLKPCGTVFQKRLKCGQVILPVAAGYPIFSAYPEQAEMADTDFGGLSWVL